MKGSGEQKGSGWLRVSRADIFLRAERSTLTRDARQMPRIDIVTFVKISSRSPRILSRSATRMSDRSPVWITERTALQRLLLAPSAFRRRFEARAGLTLLWRNERVCKSLFAVGQRSSTPRYAKTPGVHTARSLRRSVSPSSLQTAVSPQLFPSRIRKFSLLLLGVARTARLVSTTLSSHRMMFFVNSRKRRRRGRDRGRRRFRRDASGNRAGSSLLFFSLARSLAAMLRCDARDRETLTLAREARVIPLRLSHH